MYYTTGHSTLVLSYAPSRPLRARATCIRGNDSERGAHLDELPRFLKVSLEIGERGFAWNILTGYNLPNAMKCTTV